MSTSATGTPASGPIESALFLYYKLEPAAAQLAHAALAATQSQLQAAHPGLVPGRWQRPQPDAAGRITFMETYAWAPHSPGDAPELTVIQEQVAAAVDRALQAAGWPAAQRHLEPFERLA